ncbi:MAG: glucose/sorbosone dehydrogenase-like protein [Pseudonocardiales bacterium]|nr:MAG: glucose/sorbosone dehydrogenase-like protein [Pseudonocardiales bacterium]
MRHRRPRILALLAAITAGSALALATTAGPADAAVAARAATVTTAGPALGFTRIGIGFGQTVAITNSGDGTHRLFTVDRVGRVLSWVPGTSRASLYLDLRSRVLSTGGEQGLLGLTFYWNFRAIPLVYVAYTAANGSLQVSRFRLPSYASASVNPATEEKVVNVPHPTFTNHNAGMLVFGRDNQLYVSTGDGGGAGDPFAQAQSLASLSGKVLRLDAAHYCAGHPYCVPSSNPFATTAGARGEIWHFGLRNPWRFSVDPVTGAMWIADVGQDAFEEVDTVGQTAGGRNFAWSCREGFATYNAARCSATATYTAPLLVVAHPDAEALIGGGVYRGPAFAGTLGPSYIFGDYVTSTVWTVAPGSSSAVVSGSINGVTSFGTDQAREVLATSLTGQIYKLTSG